MGPLPPVAAPHAWSIKISRPALKQVCQGAAHRIPASIQDMRIDLGGAHVLVTQQFLHSTNIVAIFQQVGGERMTQAMTTGGFLDAALANRLLYRFLDGIGVHMVAPFHS